MRNPLTELIERGRGPASVSFGRPWDAEHARYRSANRAHLTPAQRAAKRARRKAQTRARRRNRR